MASVHLYISSIMSVCPPSKAFCPLNLKIRTASNSEIEDNTENVCITYNVHNFVMIIFLASLSKNTDSDKKSCKKMNVKLSIGEADCE